MRRGQLDNRSSGKISFDAEILLLPDDTPPHWFARLMFRFYPEWSLTRRDVDHRRLRQIYSYRFFSPQVAVIGPPEYRLAVRGKLSAFLPSGISEFGSYHAWRRYVEDDLNVLGGFTSRKEWKSEMIRHIDECQFKDEEFRRGH